MRTWPGFRLEQFVIVEQPDTGEWLALSAPRLTPERHLRVAHASRPVRAALQLTRLMGVPPLTVPGPLKLLYLTHLRLGAAASSLAMQALLHFVWEQVQHPAGAHAMCFREPPDVSLHGWLAHRSSGTLYSVVPTGHVAHAQLHAAASAGPLPFELAVA